MNRPCCSVSQSALKLNGSIVKMMLTSFCFPQAFCIYMLLMAFAYFLYLYIDIRLHVHRAKNELKHRIERKQRIDDYIKNVRVTFLSLQLC